MMTMDLIIPIDAFTVLIHGKPRMMTLNQWNLISRAKRGMYTASGHKKKIENRILPLFTHQTVNNKENYWQFSWYLKDRRTDLDNISFMQKFILDAAQHAGVIANDNLNQVIEIRHAFIEVDKENPRVEIHVGV